MSKKFLFLALTLILALCLFSATALAADVTVSTNKTQYTAGERVKVTVSGVTQEHINNKCWVAVYEYGGNTSAYDDWKYVTTAGTSTISLDLPIKEGSFEIRFVPQHSASDGSSAASQKLTATYAAPADNDLGSYSWEGEWDTNWEKMTLKQTGNTVTGEYEYDQGKIEGKVYGNVLIGTWAEDPTYTPPHDKGLIRFYMSEDGKSFEGAWCYDVKNPESDNWSGWSGESERLTAVISAPTTTPPPVAQPPVAQIQPPAQNVTPGSLSAVAVGSGVKLAWSTTFGSAGYRVYRSTQAGVEGISITDFMFGGADHVDVNVDANTTYYYTLRIVVKEANPATGERETLGNPSAQVSVKTGATILGGNTSEMGNTTKNMILMKLNSPNMSVNGANQEIDPGRDTTPQVMNGRTIVPIRAIIETMGGTVGWEDATSKITLTANGHSVTMWMNKKDLIVDGKNLTMDVAPVSVNGRTMVPVRFAAENLGCVVDWIASTSEIVLVYYTGGTPPQTAPTTPAPPSPQPSVPITPAPPATTEPTKPTDPPKGSIDKTLVGKWVCDKVRQIQKQVGTEMTMVSEMVQDYYQFFDDGTFLYIPYGERYSCYEGNYSASNGKLYLTNVVRRNTETDEILTNLNVSEKIEMEYEILKDGEGEYLHIASLTAFRDKTSTDLSRADNYRKK